MGIRELREKYGVRGGVNAVNAAIREEIPGGAAVLDATSALYPVLRRASISRRDRSDLETAFARLQAARDAMVAQIARRYERKTVGGAETKETA